MTRVAAPATRDPAQTAFAAQEHLENRAMTKKTEVDTTPPPFKSATQLVIGGRDTNAYHGFVNPPVHHRSTVLYPCAEDYLARRSRDVYGRGGTPTSEPLAYCLSDLQACKSARL